MAIILIDLETTGLIEAAGNPIENQPHIIEVFALRITAVGKEQSRFHSFVKPPIPLPEHITKITNIIESDLVGAPTFASIHRQLIEIFFGAHTMVAHNLPFDLGMLVNELTRIGKQ